jgi:hypothetical protein
MLKRFSAIFLSTVLFVGPGLAAQSPNNITTPCNAHLDSIGSTAPHSYERNFEWAAVPEAASQSANEKLSNTVDMIAIAPVTLDEYKTIFLHGTDKDTKNVTEAQKTEITAVQSELKAKFGRDHGDRDFDEKNYKNVLQAKTASFVIVIGHNEQGQFRLLDGSSLFLDEIVASARPNQRVILISCDSTNQVSNKKLAATINREVTYDEAFEIADQISAFIMRAGRPVSLAEIQPKLDKIVEGRQGHKVAFFIMEAACTVGAAIVIALIIRDLDPCKDKASRGCSKDKKQDDADAKGQKHSTDREQLAPFSPLRAMPLAAWSLS